MELFFFRVLVTRKKKMRRNYQSMMYLAMPFWECALDAEKEVAYVTWGPRSGLRGTRYGCLD